MYEQNRRSRHEKRKSKKCQHHQEDKKEDRYMKLLWEERNKDSAIATLQSFAAVVTDDGFEQGTGPRKLLQYNKGGNDDEEIDVDVFDYPTRVSMAVLKIRNFQKRNLRNPAVEMGLDDMRAKSSSSSFIGRNCEISGVDVSVSHRIGSDYQLLMVHHLCSTGLTKPQMDKTRSLRNIRHSRSLQQY